MGFNCRNCIIFWIFLNSKVHFFPFLFTANLKYTLFEDSKKFSSKFYKETSELDAMLIKLETLCCNNSKKITNIYRNCGSIKTNRYLIENLETSIQNLENMDDIDQLCGFVKEYLKKYISKKVYICF